MRRKTAEIVLIHPPLLKRQAYGFKGREYPRSYNRLSATSIHRFYMRKAYRLAREAGRRGEVPVGALIVHRGRILAKSGNRVEEENNGLLHAEICCLNRVVPYLGRYLQEASMYVTLEPCAMCAGAIVNMRLGRLIYGAEDPERGACGSVIDVPAMPKSLHRLKLRGGVLADSCSRLLVDFFRRRRAEAKAGRMKKRELSAREAERKA